MGAAVYELGDLAVVGRISVGRLSADLTAAVMLLPAFSITETVLELENGFPRLLALRRLRTLAPPQPAREQSVAEPAVGASDTNTPPLVRFEGVRPAAGRRSAATLRRSVLVAAQSSRLEKHLHQTITRPASGKEIRIYGGR